MKVIVVGGGPSGLMAAWKLAGLCEVHLYEKEKNVGQKFLLAGKGGLNLTNRLDGDQLLSKYSPPGFLDRAINSFDSHALREWMQLLGINTFVGSSGRIFPEKGVTTARVLKSIVNSLESRGVHIHTCHKLESFDNNLEFVFSHSKKLFYESANYAVIALGGSSWPVTGSDGKWTKMFADAGVKILGFQPSNCGVNIRWPDQFISFHEGKPLKNIALSVNGQVSKGEALITRYGLCGNAVYPLIPEIRKILALNKPTIIYVDFKPHNTIDQLKSRLTDKNIKSSDYPDFFHLNTTFITLIKAFSEKETYTNPDGFIQLLKNLPVVIDSLRPVDEAISVVGGLPLEEVNDDFSLKRFPGIYTIGEMLDWDAPTGGFLLQGCFSMGFYVAGEIEKKEVLDYSDDKKAGI